MHGEVVQQVRHLSSLDKDLRDRRWSPKVSMKCGVGSCLESSTGYSIKRGEGVAHCQRP
jgi:hypothetical protein